MASTYMQDKREIPAIVNEKISDLVHDFMNFNALKILKQEGQRCPKRQGAQAAIRLATAVITFGNKERNVRSPS